ncbi:MAG TPA: macro domain-containing protein [Thermoanaerobaculia bacterium]|nr:macro domain-containing protein [Thermoanaerobaculia bacterium]
MNNPPRYVMKVSVHLGDLTEAPADAVCTSTNPRLSLMAGTGGAVRDRGGFDVLRACEAIVQAAGGSVRIGSAHPTSAGTLPFKLVIHCVASNAVHLSSAEIVRVCVKNALACADSAACRSLAMPVFATGHAGLKFDRAVNAMAEALRDASTLVEQVIIVINEPDRAEMARRIISSVIEQRNAEGVSS